jgi:hypothetical protein
MEEFELSSDGINYLLPEPRRVKIMDTSEQAVERAARAFVMGSDRQGKHREVRQKLEDRVVKRIGHKGKYLTDKLFELIEGIYVIEKHKVKGIPEIRYYKVPPNLQAITYALDRVLGKPTVSTPENEQKKGITIVEKIIKNLAGDMVETSRSVEIKE